LPTLASVTSPHSPPARGTCTSAARAPQAPFTSQAGWKTVPAGGLAWRVLYACSSPSARPPPRSTLHHLSMERCRPALPLSLHQQSPVDSPGARRGAAPEMLVRPALPSAILHASRSTARDTRPLIIPPPCSVFSRCQSLIHTLRARLQQSDAPSRHEYLTRSILVLATPTVW
jgi:hypothetical protein